MMIYGIKQIYDDGTDTCIETLSGNMIYVKPPIDVHLRMYDDDGETRMMAEIKLYIRDNDNND